MDRAVQRNFVRGVAAGVVVIAVAAALVYFFHFATYHFAVVQDGVLYRMGMRNTRELRNTIDKVHPKAVVCLVSDQEVNDPSKGDFQGEFALLKEKGITLYRIPLRENQMPSQEQIAQFLQIVGGKENQPVIVHCAQGVVRTGMMVAAYQRNRLGYDKQQALAAVKIFGKGTERADEVRQFINQYYDQYPQRVATAP